MGNRKWLIWLGSAVVALRFVLVLDQAKREDRLPLFVGIAVLIFGVWLVVLLVRYLLRRVQPEPPEPLPLPTTIGALEPANVKPWLQSRRLQVTRQPSGLRIHVPANRFLASLAIAWMFFPLLIVFGRNEPEASWRTGSAAQIFVGYSFILGIMFVGNVLPSIWFLRGDTFRLTPDALYCRTRVWPFLKWNRFEWQLIRSIYAPSSPRSFGILLEYEPDLGMKWNIGQHIKRSEIPALLALLAWCKETSAAQLSQQRAERLGGHDPRSPVAHEPE